MKSAQAVLKKFFTPEQIVGDIRSAAVGGIAGVVTSSLLALLTWYIAGSVTFTAFPSEDGYAQPLVELVDAAVEEDSDFKIDFRPSELKMLYICEYRETTGKNTKDTLISYMSSYQSCLNIRQAGPDSIVVRPNLISGDLEYKDNAWQCKCGDL